MGAALAPDKRKPAAEAESAHRDVRDGWWRCSSNASADPVDAEGGYALPFPVLSEVDAATLAVTLEDGVAGA